MDEFLILVVDQDRKKVDGFYILNSPPPPSPRKILSSKRSLINSISIPRIKFFPPLSNSNAKKERKC